MSPRLVGDTDQNEAQRVMRGDMGHAQTIRLSSPLPECTFLRDYEGGPTKTIIITIPRVHEPVVLYKGTTKRVRPVLQSFLHSRNTLPRADVLR